MERASATRGNLQNSWYVSWSLISGTPGQTDVGANRYGFHTYLRPPIHKLIEKYDEDALIVINAGVDDDGGVGSMNLDGQTLAYTTSRQDMLIVSAKKRKKWQRSTLNAWRILGY